ncbi:MAG: nodulation protein NfeD [Promethearchaeota archaeon]
MKKGLITLGLILIFVGLFVPTLVNGQQTLEPKIVRLDIHGEINTITEMAVNDAIAYAEEVDADLIWLDLDTPGGLLTAVENIMNVITMSSIPVLSYVRSVAWSGGTYILMASHIAAMAPSAAIGSCQPVNEFGTPIVDSKIINALVKLMETHAEIHNRNTTIAREFITINLNLDAQEALNAGVIEFAPTTEESLFTNLEDVQLLEYLEGTGSEPRWIVLGANEDVSGYDIQQQFLFTDFSDSNTELYFPGITLTFLALISNPIIVGLLFFVGIVALVFGLVTPGAGAEILGTICLILALAGGLIIQASFAALLLICLGAFLIYLEVKKGAMIFAVGGIVCFALAAIFIFPSASFLARTDLVFVRFFLLVVSVCLGVILLFMSAKAQATRKMPPKIGKEQYIGEIATVVETFSSENLGKVKFQGSLWNAATMDPEELYEGEDVQIIAVDGLTLWVTRPKYQQPAKKSYYETN